MSTGVSSTDLAEPVEPPEVSRRIDVAGLWADALRAVADVGILLRFRAGTVTRRGRARVALGLLLTVTVAFAVVPALTNGAGLKTGRAFDIALLLPSALAGVLVVAIISAAASGGGRELLARDPAGVLPISPTTDHLGALLLAPLNVAWLLQFWALLFATSYSMGLHHLLGAQVLTVLWMAVATAAAQVIAWALECVRRAPRGVVGVRLLSVLFFGVAIGLQAAHELVRVLDRLPTRRVVLAMEDAAGGWVVTAFGLALLLAGLVVIGAVPAHIAARRLPRDELRLETGSYQARRPSRTATGTLLRLDRASVWRAVTMRRGVLVLALGPGLVAVLGDLSWQTMTILPGLVASGGALLYGVNAWCLDGRGALWRESLPVSPGVVFAVRAYVLAEFLLVASVITVLVAATRAGLPGPSELTALVCALLVVTVQVAGGALRWASTRPFAVDLRSARATPAPPTVMVGYSARLALSTTVTGLLFSWLSLLDDPSLIVGLALPCLIWSGGRLAFTRRDWLDPVRRSRVVTTVAAG